MDAADYVNELPPSSRLGSLDDFLKEETLASPVDMYRRSIGQILQYGTQARLAESDFVGRLLIFGIVSAAEAYFRAILSSCIELCPVAQSIASKKMISLGGLLWHGQPGFSRSAFEHTSFTSKEELTKVCREYLGFSLEDRIFKDSLEEFDNICQLRHGIVHGDGLLPGKNAIQLNIQRYTRPVRITVRYQQIQEVTAVINTLVMIFNRQLFLKMSERWAIAWRQRADWTPDFEKRSFGAIWKIFHCADEFKGKRPRAKFTKSNCLSAVRTQYDI